MTSIGAPVGVLDGPRRRYPDGVKLIGLGGGIGAGKSTVSASLAERGAVIVDADLIARQVVEPDGPAYAPIVERFGEGVLHDDRTLNRQALASIVFTDKDALAALNSITHPAIGRVIAAQIEAQTGTDRIVILDAALLFDAPRVGMVAKVLVDVDPEIAIQRLVQFRGFAESDARNRIANQMSRDERRAQADYVIDNSGDRDALNEQIDAAWRWMATLPDSPVAPEGTKLGDRDQKRGSSSGMPPTMPSDR
jgi:dephospho-CoA kinase